MKHTPRALFILRAFIVVLSVSLTAAIAHAQIDILGKVEEKIEQKVDEKTDEAIDKALEDGEKPADADSEKKEETGATSSSTTSTTSAAPASFKSYSKFDFIPGENVTFYENFSEDAIGDFPANWNTNGSGEVVTIDGFDGRWLKWSAGVAYSPNLTTSFPDNFTLEFDLVMLKPEGKADPYFGLSIYASDKDNMNEDFAAGTILTAQGAWSVDNVNGGDYQNVGASQQVTISDLYEHKTHISIWGQKQRMRVYANEIKVLDLPRGFPKDVKLNKVRFVNNPGLNISNDDAGFVFLSNVRVAVGAPDMRSKLMTEGKLVTHGILFDVNSDKIKAESYGTLKEIAKVLSENAAVRVTIVGHTDSDGEDAKNLDLSKKRAAAVKASLAKDFAIDASRMETDGKGEAQPAAPNTSSEGKANNRRVEFVKIK
jgi:OmpA-OmpF porin, OOP family